MCGESTGHERAGNAELCYFLWYAPGQTIEHTVELPVLWDAVTLMWRLSVMFTHILQGCLIGAG